MNSPTQTWAARAGLAAFFAAVALASGGCQGMGWFAQAFSGEKHVDAVADLTQGRLLVLVDESIDQPRTPDSSLIRTDVEKAIRKELSDPEHAVNRQIVSSEEVRRVQAAHLSAREWSPTRLGAEVGADRVLLVTMGRYRAPSPAANVEEQAKLVAHVKVFQCSDGDQVWPIEALGEEIVFEDPNARGRIADPAGELPRLLAEGLGRRVARLFYRHTLTSGEEARLEAEGIEQ